ncbi:MAG: branched-chain amino acid ABC transporter permease [Anaerolineae bacterium]|nr:branched-chain amino acid ABC transporter permease [Anaerolineae bacterium]
MKALWARRNLVNVIAFTVVLAALGAVDIFRPFGLSFSALTGRVVTLDTMIRIGILTIVVVGLNLLMGYAGQVSLGQAGFYALGAYFSGILSTLATRHTILPGITGLWWWPWLMIVVSMILTGGFAYLVGKPILRLKGNYLAMATLGLGVIIHILAGQFPDITGGYDGLTGVPRLSIGSFTLWPMQRYYFLVWGAAIAVIVISLSLVDSRIGRALRAVHTSEVAAEASGVDAEQYKVQALVLSAIFASLAGSLYAHFQGAVSPSPFSFRASVELVVMAAVGGLASTWGAPFGVGLIYVVRDLLKSQLERLLNVRSGEYELIVYGIILVSIMIFMPEGLTASSVQFMQGRRRRHGNIEPQRVQSNGTVEDLGQ